MNHGVTFQNSPIVSLIQQTPTLLFWAKQKVKIQTKRTSYVGLNGTGNDYQDPQDNYQLPSKQVKTES